MNIERIEPQEYTPWHSLNDILKYIKGNLISGDRNQNSVYIWGCIMGGREHMGSF